MPLLALILILAGALFATGVAALGARPGGRWGDAVYGVAAGLSGVLCLAALGWLAAGAGAVGVVLPLGLPWLGMHFRLDALAAFFALVVNLGGALACVYAIGYGRGEAAPRRVLPFVPAFLAAMNLVLLAADAFTFLLLWELMSLCSWA